MDRQQRQDQIISNLGIGPQILPQNGEAAGVLAEILQEFAESGDVVALLQAAQMATQLASLALHRQAR